MTKKLVNKQKYKQAIILNKEKEKTPLNHWVRIHKRVILGLKLELLYMYDLSGICFCQKWAFNLISS